MVTRSKPRSPSANARKHGLSTTQRLLVKSISQELQIKALRERMDSLQLRLILLERKP